MSDPTGTVLGLARCSESKSQPFPRTYFSQAPAAWEVRVATSTSVVKNALLMIPAS